ncbi:MAG: hypothetical protein MJ200_04820 [Mycoplasmoidaceae bacterium]|nr:hypothetical protein [Mycoplasmoidaceae bacterium]
MATGQSFFEVKRQIEYDIDYQKVEVQKPDRYEYDINIDKTLPFSAPVLTGELPNIDTSAEFNLAIDCSYCEKSPV